MRLFWATDIHLDYLSPTQRNAWILQCGQALSEHDAILLTGDICTSVELPDVLTIFASLQCPVYFVLGNHDYYHNTIAHTRIAVEQLCEQESNLHWLSREEPIIWNNLALIGHEGWGDGQNGAYLETPIRIQDALQILDFQGLSRALLQEKLKHLGQEGATHIQQNIETSIQRGATKILVCTHVPPFPESAWHNGEWGHWNYLPDFTCKAVGDILLHCANQYPTVEFEVRCGHGHSEGIAQMLPNLQVITGKAEYGNPQFQEIILL